MLLFDLLGLHTDAVHPDNSKLHLAVDPGHSDPLTAFFAGRFEDWQTWQTRKNFPREFIVALIKLSADRWLFAGCFEKLGVEWVEEPKPPHWSYSTRELPETAPLAGRLVVRFRRTRRASYLYAEKVAGKLEVASLREQRMTIGDFPGYRSVSLTKARLDLVVQQDLESWRSALSAVAGVYLITDEATGKLYVGSATGAGGLWSRWSAYSKTGHGGNKDLRRVLREKGAGYAQHFRYSILEVADTHASADDVVDRESHWKRVLCSREHGYNRN